jgi:hypothetical protein
LDAISEILRAMMGIRDDGRPSVFTNGFDLLLEALEREHGLAGRPDIAPQLQAAEQLLKRTHGSIDDMMPAYRRLLAS